MRNHENYIDTKMNNEDGNKKIIKYKSKARKYKLSFKKKNKTCA
jgi:hypothetical protein